MNGIDKATEDLCSTCYLNEMGLCDPTKDVCYNLILRSVAYLIADAKLTLNKKEDKK